MSTEALVQFTTRNWKEIVQKAQGKDASKPETVYEFSNGRTFQSTDNSDHGIYED